MADDNLRQDMVDQVREEQQQRQRAPRVHKAPVERDAASTDRVDRPAEAEALASADSAPKKRRRRRRTSGPREGGEPTQDTGA